MPIFVACGAPPTLWPFSGTAAATEPEALSRGRPTWVLRGARTAGNAYQRAAARPSHRQCGDARAGGGKDGWGANLLRRTAAYQTDGDGLLDGQAAATSSCPSTTRRLSARRAPRSGSMRSRRQDDIVVGGSRHARDGADRQKRGLKAGIADRRCGYSRAADVGKAWVRRRVSPPRLTPNMARRSILLVIKRSSISRM